MKSFYPLLSLWISPRKTIQKVHLEYAPRNDVRLIALFSLCIFIQLALFLTIINEIPLGVFISTKGIEGMIWSFITLAVGSYTYANLTALLAWKIAGWLKGTGTLVSTRTAILWSMFGYLPVGFSLLLIYFAYSLKVSDKPIPLLAPVSLIVFPFALIYSFGLMLKLFAETHRISLLRSCACLLLSALAQASFLFLLFALFRKGGG